MAMGLTFCVVVFGPNWVQSNSLFASGLGVVFGAGNGDWDVVAINPFSKSLGALCTRGRQILCCLFVLHGMFQLCFNHWARCKISVKQAGI